MPYWLKRVQYRRGVSAFTLFFQHSDKKVSAQWYYHISAVIRVYQRGD